MRRRKVQKHSVNRLLRDLAFKQEPVTQHITVRDRDEILQSERLKILGSFLSSDLVELIGEKTPCGHDRFAQASRQTARASARLDHAQARPQFKSEQDLTDIWRVQDLSSLGQTARVSISVGSQHVDVVSLVCRVDFGAVLLEVNEIRVVHHAFGRLVAAAFRDDLLLL